jgi:glycerol kinase
MLFDIRHNVWDHELLKALHVPDSVLPQVHPSSHVFGETTLLGGRIPIAGMAGDQQSALFGQACFTPGLAKNTYGTGCFMLMHTGAQFQGSRHGLITTAAAQATTQPQYAQRSQITPLLSLTTPSMRRAKAHRSHAGHVGHNNEHTNG